MDALVELRYALDTFYLLLSGALVMWMAAGFAMLESGLVRAKNTAEILTKIVALYAVASIMYLLLGYSVMYPGVEAAGPYWSHFDFMAEPAGGGGRHSAAADFFFQLVFAATAMSIVSGAVAERMKLWSFLFFAIAMTGFIYPLQGYWNWGGGFLKTFGYFDYAGSGTVHLCGASAALAGVLLLGPRKGKYGRNGEINAIPGANLPLAALGTLVLWLGWFGFNGGSEFSVSTASSADHVARIFVNTNTAAAGGVLAALLLARLLFGKADLTMALNGAIAGLVAITADPLSPAPGLATLIGAAAGVLVIFSIIILDKLKIDDPVGAISAHGVSGIWGLLAVTVSQPADGVTVIQQLAGVIAIFGWTFSASLVAWFLLKKIFGIRVNEEQEYIGVDLSECGLEAYPEFTSNK
jgi:ammonium transporter, Amt family